MCVFDVDGTLVEKNIGLTFVKYLLKRGLVNFPRRLQLTGVFILYKLKILDFAYAIRAGAWALAGLRTDDVEKFARDCYEKEIGPTLFKDAVSEINLRKAEGQKIVIATGAHEAIAKQLAHAVSADYYVSTESKRTDGVYTSEIFEPMPYKDGKRSLVSACIKDRIGDCVITVYTDEKKDIPLLSIADHLVAVNADPETRNYVLSRGGREVVFS